MPNPEIQRLDPKSEKAQIQAALSACIAQEVSSGRDQDQAVAMCHQMIKDQMGGVSKPPTPPTI